MLVLLGLFPIVMLEMRFLSPILAGWASMPHWARSSATPSASL